MMKRFLAIILALLLAFSLFACNQNTADDPSTSPSESTASPSSDTSPDDATPSEPAGDSTIGYLTDDVDHFAREPYKLISMALNTSTTYTQRINDNLALWGTVFNYEVVNYNANEDYDAYVNELEVQTMAGADGFFAGMSGPLVARTYEICTELGVDCIGCPTPFTDEEGHIIYPSVNQDEYGNGAALTHWLLENYTNYWADPIDEETLGIIVITFSPVSGIQDRLPGVQDVIAAELPAAVDHTFVADCVAHPDGFSSTAAYDLTSQYITANPDLDKWFVIALVDDWAVGATRSVENMDKTDSVLVVSVQADAFLNEIESTGDSVYIAANAISVAELTGYMASGLVAMLDGRATAESLWPEWVRDGDMYPCVDLPGTMITRDNYEQWVQDTDFYALSAGMATS